VAAADCTAVARDPYVRDVPAAAATGDPTSGTN
jgi:hypothetical protein